MSWQSEARDRTGRWIVGSVAGSAADDILHAVGRRRPAAALHGINTGQLPDTKALHTNTEGAYSAERAQLHQHIIEHFMADTRAHTQPEAIFTAGGAASGKSSLAGRVSEAGRNLPVPRGHVYVNPDDIKQMLPEYQELAEGGRPELSVAATHEESSDIAKLLTAIAVARKRHLVIDGTGNTDVGKFGDKLRNAKAAGYKVTARYAHIPVETAIEREQLRAQKTGRKVDEQVLRHQHAMVSRSFAEDVKNIKGVRVEVHSTVGRGKPTLIAEKTENGPTMRVIKGTQYREMIAKGSANA